MTDDARATWQAGPFGGARDDASEEAVYASALVAGDDSAFATLIDRETDSVFRICYRILGEIEEAEEAAQEVFIQAMRSLPTYRGDGPPSAWIARIAVREAYRRDRSRMRMRKATAPLTEDTMASVVDPLDTASAVEAAEHHERLRLAVSTLPEPYREVITLRYFGDLSLAGISEVTGRPLGTVKAQVHRGLARLRRRVAEA